MNNRELSEIAQTLQRDLLYYGARLNKVIPEFRSHFVPHLKAGPFVVKKLTTDTAFTISRSGLITFNATGFKLFHAPIDSMEAAGRLSPDLAAIARQIAAEQLIVHELAHVSSGFIEYSDVQHFKDMVGANALGELDLLADVTAAQICARNEMYRAQEKGIPNYAFRLQQQLLVMGNFAFPAFGAPADKLHKRQRFLGLAMMGARLKDVLSRKGCKLEPGEFPIDTPIYPYLDETDGRMILSAFTPSRKFWGRTAQVDPELLKVICDELDNVGFEMSVHRAGMLLRQIGRLKGPVSKVTGKFSAAEAAIG